MVAGLYVGFSKRPRTSRWNPTRGRLPSRGNSGWCRRSWAPLRFSLGLDQIIPSPITLWFIVSKRLIWLPATTSPVTTPSMLIWHSSLVWANWKPVTTPCHCHPRVSRGLCRDATLPERIRAASLASNMRWKTIITRQASSPLLLGAMKTTTRRKIQDSRH